MNKGLTIGKPSKTLWLFCMPLFGSVIFQQLYNIADSFVAGKYIGENALAAVGNGYEITLIFIAFAFGCNIGCSVVVSQFFGAKRYGDMKTAVYTSFIACSVLCAVLMAVGLSGCNFLLNLINTPKETFADSALYLKIYILGLPFVLYYNVCNGIFSALGDSKTPFIFLALSSTSNIAADILFVKGFNTGIEGIAWATFMCQGISCVLAVIFVLKRLSKIKTDDPFRLFDKAILIRISKIAVPSILQQSFISVGNIAIQGVINSFGAAVMAGYSASVKLNNLVITSFTTIGNGISNYTAQNMGACKQNRIPEGFRAGIKMVWLICVPIAILYLSCGRYIIGAFMDVPSPDALASGYVFLILVSPFYFVISAKLIADGVLRGLGLMKQFMIATFTDLLLRVLLAFVLSKTALGWVGIWCSWPIGWTVGALISIIYYKKNVNK